MVTDRDRRFGTASQPTYNDGPAYAEPVAPAAYNPGGRYVKNPYGITQWAPDDDPIASSWPTVEVAPQKLADGKPNPDYVDPMQGLYDWHKQQLDTVNAATGNNYVQTKPTAGPNSPAELYGGGGPAGPTTPPVVTPPAPTGPDPKRLQYSNRFQSAYDNALNYGKNKLRSQGYTPEGAETDPYGVFDLYRSEIDRMKGDFYDMDPDPNIYWNDQIADPGSVFSGYDTTFNTLLSDKKSGNQRNIRSQFDQRYGSGDYSSYLSDDVLGSSISGILDPQYADATTQIENAYKRGLLSDAGKQSALGDINKSKSNAFNEINLYGKGLLDTGRNAIGSYFGTKRSSIGDLDLGDSFDLDSIDSGARNLGQTQGASVSSQLNNMYGTRQFFDPSQAINNAKRIQGSSGSNSQGSLLDTMKSDELKRSSGSQGAF